MVEGSKTLVIKNQAGRVIDITLMNEKAFNKSTENAILWYLHPETTRVLPYGDGAASFRDLYSSKKFYEVTLLVEDEVKVNSSQAAADINYSGTQQDLASFLFQLSDLIRNRKKEMPEGSYTSHLFKSGIDKIRKKTGEEAVELILASKREDIIYESADLVYHMLVMLAELDIDISEVLSELKSREG